MNSNSVFTQHYQVNSTHIDISKKLSLSGLLGILQDAASSHANVLGFGYDKMVKHHIFWVLIRQKVKIKQMPSWNDTICIKTWTKPLKGFYAEREFELYVNNIKIGECATTWMILDSKTHRPTKPDFLDEIVNPRTDYSLDFEAQKISIRNDLKPQKYFEVYNSHLDMNNHVNNVKYSQFITDCVPLKYYKSHIINEFEINFLQESFLGETLLISTQITDKGNITMYFKAEKDTEEKNIFIAQLKMIKSNEA